ncbi:ABC transporter substrate-binding protein [Pseudoscardovia radai]|uniref:ABC transporter substrate-binding protein n=1 Tax=Pseudoscardovia radai TaxID=987066 RepID=UPI003993E981
MVIHMGQIRNKAKKMAMTATAAAVAAVLALGGCGSSSGTSGSGSSAASGGFVLGALMPLTGSLAYMSAAEVAAVQLAIDDINDAGGVNGADATFYQADTSDADHADQNTSAAEDVLSHNPSAIVGPASSAVVRNVYQEITEAHVPMTSMGSTSTSFSGLSDYFFRTVPPDTVQGTVLGNVIAQDGVQNLAIAAFNDEYGTGLRDQIAKTAGDQGVNIVYGADQAFDPTETNFSSIVTAIKASGADAIAIVAFDQTETLIRELITQGVDTTHLYLVDGNTSDYSDEFAAGALTGSKGTIPGAHASDEFQSRLQGVSSTQIDDFTYAAETYDAVILEALAAEKGKANDGETVQANMMAVSGSTGGEKCESYKDCKALLDGGKEIQYSGQCGIGPWNDDHDPSTASIGIYEYDGSNVPKFSTSEQGNV